MQATVVVAEAQAKPQPEELVLGQAMQEMAEGYGSRTHQARVAHLTGFEVRALHREAIPFLCSGLGSVTVFLVT